MATPTHTSTTLPTVTAPCTPDTCPIDWALIRYFPNVAGNALYLALFAIMLVAQFYHGVRFKTWSFLGCMSGGLLLEVIGYAGRLILHSNPFNFSAFLQYLICLTIAPAFITAAIYLSLSRIITIYGSGISRLQPATYAKIFVTCDILCLVLQAAGGAVTATAGRDQDGLRQTGINIMIAGLAAQVVCLGVFMGLAGEFFWRVKREQRWRGQDHGARGTSGGLDWKWKGFLWGASLLPADLPVNVLTLSNNKRTRNCNPPHLHPLHLPRRRTKWRVRQRPRQRRGLIYDSRRGDDGRCLRLYDGVSSGTVP
ncbi:RTA1 like protein-domain-containing protein [Aspergillus pseudodeflectus]|uniref:RTA1 like protein-domain-containing protein n=1 Tax=Aspergillus pseudodeflectus TaxID=176178 RepID=A0ABR4JY06_9EURO